MYVLFIGRNVHMYGYSNQIRAWLLDIKPYNHEGKMNLTAPDGIGLNITFITKYVLTSFITVFT